MHPVPFPMHPHQPIGRLDSARKFSRRYLSSSSCCPPLSATSLALFLLPSYPTFQLKLHKSLKLSSQSLPRYPCPHPFPHTSHPPDNQLNPSTPARLIHPPPSSPQLGWDVLPTTKVCSFSTRKRSPIIGCHRQVSQWSMRCATTSETKWLSVLETRRFDPKHTLAYYMERAVECKSINSRLMDDSECDCT
jgi:hypothetical protein